MNWSMDATFSAKASRGNRNIPREKNCQTRVSMSTDWCRLGDSLYFPAVCAGHGMIGTALTLFLGLPSISLSL